MSNIAISVSNVSKCYRVYDNQRSRLLHTVFPAYTQGMQEVWALKDINFEIKRGEAVAIIGRNGGGKSTLLEILTGTLTPTTGSVKVNGRVSALLELGSGFNPEYSGRDNVILNGLLLGLSKDDILSRFDEIEAFAEIGAAINRPVKTYSSGMMMRLAFAVQVLCDPDILIIDEALSVGDFFFQQKCFKHIRSLVGKGVTLILVSHDIGTVVTLCKTSIYLRGGKIFGMGASQLISQEYFRHGVASDELDSPVFNNSENKGAESLSGNLDRVCYENSKIWTNSGDLNDGESRILSVAILSEDGMSSDVFKIGQLAHIVVEYIPDSRRSSHITIGLKDKYGKLCAATGSAQLGLDGTSGATRSIYLKFSIQLLLEAGNYSIFFTLGYLLNPTVGERLDITPDIGPIRIEWNYNDGPPSFIGAIGLPSTGSYVNVI